ncbi:MAG: ATP-binding protein [Desulfuromusa sp.]
MWIARLLKEKIETACTSRPAVLVTGARQTGKSSLLQRMFPAADYVTLDRVIVAAEAEENPSSFLDRFDGQTIIDEIQYAPSLLRELKIRIDNNRDDCGRWILTGSQKMELMKGVSESLAGRIGILQLETLSAKELRGVAGISATTVFDHLWKGGYPELWSNPAINPESFYEDYVQTYLERDLKTLIQVTNLRDFQRFVQICATRTGQLLNYTDMAKDVGVSAVTIKSWLGALEASGIIYLLPPFFANIGKRLVKAPKLFFADTGLLCHLLNVQDRQNYFKSPHSGHIWENLVFAEIIKTLPVKPGRQLFFYRDQNGVEMDFIVELGGKLHLIEAKSAERIDKRKLNFHKIAPLFKNRETRCALICASTEKTPIELRDYSIINPLRHDLAEIIS